MYNYSRLLGKMREKGITQENLSKSAHIGLVSLNRSLLHDRPFRQDEMINILKVLEEPIEMIEYYFFCGASLEN